MAQGLRGVALDVELWDERFEPARLNSSHTVLGYDMAFVSVSNLLPVFTQGEVLGSGRVSGAPIKEGEALRSLQSLLGQRRDEFDRFLLAGGTLVVLLDAPERYAEYVGLETRRSDAGGDQTVRVHAIRTTVAECLPVELTTTPLSGGVMESSTSGPFANFWARWGDVFTLRAAIEVPSGTGTVRVKGTDRTAAAVIRHGPGTVVLLPDIQLDNIAMVEESGSALAEPVATADEDAWDEDSDNPAAVAFVDDIIEMVARTAGTVALPAWADTVVLPGEQKARSRVTAAQSKVDEWTAEVAERRAAVQAIERRKGLLTASGDALEQLVDEALVALGFKVAAGEAGRVDRVIRLGERVAVVEVKGVKGSAKESNAAQLTKWVADYHATHDLQPKGILVVNAFRQTPLAERTQDPFPHQMLAYAADQQRYCLVTTEQLLVMWLATEADPSRAAGFATGLLDCVGVQPGERFVQGKPRARQGTSLKQGG